jgi:hypothetical protein
LRHTRRQCSYPASPIAAAAAETNAISDTSTRKTKLTPMDEVHAALINEIRYSERLCQRTARMYRRVQTIGTFGAVLGGSATVAALAQSTPAWLVIGGAVVFAVFGAALLAIRPADKAAQNEADQRRYAKLRAEGVAMTADALRSALAKARESDAAEVEPLRDVAWNDVVREIGWTDKAVPLSISQRVIAALA